MMHNESPSGKSSANQPTFTAQDEVLMREPSRSREDVAQREHLIRQRTSTLQAMVITLAIVLAPFIALMFSTELALGMLGAGLVFTSIVTWNGAKRVGAALRPRLKTAAILNGVLAVAIIGVLGMMIR